MTLGTVDPANPAFLAYVLAFGIAAVAAFASVARARQIEDPDTRRGMIALLLTSGAWATAHVGFVAAPTEGIAVAFYEIGLVVGLAAVGPWLYFCSAFTGRSLHRNPTVRRVAVGIFLAIVAVKLVNPYNLYFSTEFVTTPFPHTTVHNGMLHWLAMGLSYALSIVGFFMLFELFARVSYRTRPLVVLVAISGLPIVLDLAGHASPAFIDITYEPIGVAAFAVGVLFVYLERFQAVRMAGERDVPVIVLDESDEIHEYNGSARELFPEALDSDALGRPLEAVVPSVADRLGSETPILSFEDQEGTRYYRVSSSPFTADRSRIGRMVTLVDVTHREQYRQELERQNDRLEEFASMVSHDLRNPLTVAKGQIENARGDADREELTEAAAALDRMEALIEDLLARARQGQPVEEPEPTPIADVAHGAWSMVDADGVSLDVAGDTTIRADPDRLQQLFENLFRNAIEHGESVETVTVGELSNGTGFYVADDGVGVPEDARDEVFETGYTTNADGTGFGLAIVTDIADAHGWNVTLTESEGGGARFEFRDVEPA